MDNFMDNKKRINKLWKDNPKIPFMQSKDILALGYEFGYIDAKNIKNNESKNNESKNNSKITKEVLSKKEKYDILIKVTADILANFNITKDFLSAYEYVQNLNREYQDKLFYIKRNIEFMD